MPPIRKPKAKKRGERKNRVPPKPTPASTSQSPLLLEAFFATYAPRFQYDATRSASLEFYRLCDEFGWDKEDSKRETAHQKFKDALVRQFNTTYGTDVDDLGSWQNLCHIVRIDPIPDDLHACREASYPVLLDLAVRYTFVNLVDLVDTKNTGVKVQVFESECALSEYTIKTGKYFPKDHDFAGGLLRYLLRRILHPRSEYDTSRGRKGKGRKRRR